jgi:putative transposase
MSERRACRVIGIDRTSVRYQATRGDDGDLRERIKTLASEASPLRLPPAAHPAAP